jgi:uncharacterized membrane protein YphA (DoxX/SURF4 family)
MTVDPVVMIALSLMLSYVVVDAGLHKVRNPRHYAAVIDDYRVLPRNSGWHAVWLAGGLEIAAGVAILLPPLHRAGLLLCALLLAAYLVAIALNLWRGRREIDCGCGAPDQAQGLSGALLLRNALLVLAALLLAAAQPAARVMGWFDWLVTVCAALVAILVYLSANLLLANTHLLVRLK